MPAVRSMPAIGTTATVVVDDPDVADAALALLAADLAAPRPGVQPVPPRLGAPSRRAARRAARPG